METSKEHPIASIVIPAHNEERHISSTLSSALNGALSGEFRVIVVCNGCTDATAEVARQYGPGVEVIEISEASKSKAMQIGADATDIFPRVYQDADVQITARSLRKLVDACNLGALASGPTRYIDLSDSSVPVRLYYQVWQRLPQVRNGLFGRGAIAISELGHARVRLLPKVMSDDLAISEAFSDSERLVLVDALSLIHAPRTLGGLIRRRTRVAVGNAQVDRMSLRSVATKTRLADIIYIASSSPSRLPGVVVFLFVAVLARLRGLRAVARSDYSTWLRDEDSRGAACS